MPRQIATCVLLLLICSQLSSIGFCSTCTITVPLALFNSQTYYVTILYDDSQIETANYVAGIYIDPPLSYGRDTLFFGINGAGSLSCSSILATYSTIYAAYLYTAPAGFAAGLIALYDPASSDTVIAAFRYCNPGLGVVNTNQCSNLNLGIDVTATTTIIDKYWNTVSLYPASVSTCPTVITTTTYRNTFSVPTTVTNFAGSIQIFVPSTVSINSATTNSYSSYPIPITITDYFGNIDVFLASTTVSISTTTSTSTSTETSTSTSTATVTSTTTSTSTSTETVTTTPIATVTSTSTATVTSTSTTTSSVTSTFISFTPYVSTSISTLTSIESQTITKFIAQSTTLFATRTTTLTATKLYTVTSTYLPLPSTSTENTNESNPDSTNFTPRLSSTLILYSISVIVIFVL